MSHINELFFLSNEWKIGIVYFKHCPRQPYIPIYLFVMGSFGVVKALFNTVRQVRRKRDDEEDELDRCKPNPASILINCFLFAWFCTGKKTIIFNNFYYFE